MPKGDVIQTNLGVPRSNRASPATRSEAMGLRSCGIAEDPFCPERNGSALADLAALQMPNLGGKPLQRGADQRNGG